jgi:hypothetical protein
MDDDEPASDGDEEQSVVTPDPVAWAEDAPGKKVVHRHGTTSIEHIDVKNAAHMSYLDRLCDRASEINDEVQIAIAKQKNESSANLTTSQIGVKLVESYSLTLTYFEGVSFQFLRWAWEMDHELVGDVQDKMRGDFPDGSPNSWNKEARKSLSDAMSTLKWIKVLDELDPSTKSFDALHTVKKRRGAFIHSPSTALEFQKSNDSYPGKQLENMDVDVPESVQNLQERESLEQIVADCQDALQEITDLVDKHLPIDEETYRALKED